MDLTKDNLDFWKSLTPLLCQNCLAVEDGRLIYAGEGFSELLATPVDKLFGHHADEFFSLENGSSFIDALQDLQSSSENSLNLNLVRVNDQSISRLIMNVTFKPHQVLGASLIIGVMQDPELDASSGRKLEAMRTQLNAILDNFSNTIFRTNAEGEITLISDNVKELMGYTREEVLGTKLADYYWTPEDRERSLQQIVQNEGKVTQIDSVMRHKDGSPVWLSSNVHLIINEQGETLGVEGVGHDVTYQKKLEQKLETLALTDNLTHMPNRRALMDELHNHFISASKDKSSLALIMIKIKDTRSFNERFGYLYGDALIKQAATLLKVYTQFPQVFGRLSGDEFLYILPGYTIKNATQFITPVIEAVKQNPLPVGNKKVSYALSIGITELRKSDNNEFSLLDRADKATRVSRQGMNKYEVM